MVDEGDRVVCLTTQTGPTPITEAAFRLCQADWARVFLREGDELVAGPLAPLLQTDDGYARSGQ